MAIIEIDDGLYLDALQYIRALEGKHGIGEAFEGWVKAHQPPYESWELENLAILFAGLIGHYSGEYDPETGPSKEKRIAWSFCLSSSISCSTTARKPRNNWATCS